MTSSVIPRAIHGSVREFDFLMFGAHEFTNLDLEILGLEASCAICQDTLEDDNHYFIILTCGHILHSHCGKTWLNTHRHCPYCRRDVNLKFRRDHDDELDLLNRPEIHLDKDSLSVREGHSIYCAICRNELERGRQIELIPWITMECGHYFHAECFSNWINRRNLCPLDNLVPILTL